VSVNFGADRDRLSDETFERVFGPANYAFVYGNVHFLVLDDVMYPVGEGYDGGLREEQLAFVENYLDHVSEEKLVVLATHIPVSSIREADRERLLALLSKQPHTLSLAGHWHTQSHSFLGREQGWKRKEPHHQYSVGTTSGSWWSGMKSETGVPHAMMSDGTPNGYAFITFDDNEYVIDYKVAGLSATYRMNIHTPRQISRGTDTTDVKLTVNVFNGTEKTEVAYRVGTEGRGNQWKKSSARDPYYMVLYQRWQNFEKTGRLDSLKSLRFVEEPPVSRRPICRVGRCLAQTISRSGGRARTHGRYRFLRTFQLGATASRYVLPTRSGAPSRTCEPFGFSSKRPPIDLANRTDTGVARLRIPPFDAFL
jgi:hypothetical protein